MISEHDKYIYVEERITKNIIFFVVLMHTKKLKVEVHEIKTIKEAELATKLRNRRKKNRKQNSNKKIIYGIKEKEISR